MKDLLKDRVAIITGARRGIGKGMIQCLAESGCKVLFTDIDRDEGQATETALTRDGFDVKFTYADTSNPDDANDMAKMAMDTFGRIDILCPNAAIYPQTDITDISAEEWDEVCAVNLKGPFLAAKACAPFMKAQRHGRVILTSSITGPIVSSSGHAHYAATKAGILGFMRSAALEWAPWGITVNAIEPGNILTEGMKLHRSQDFIDSQRDAVPLGRLGTPEDIGKAVRFLASSEADYITGQTIVIDGGQTLPEMQTAILPPLA